MQRYPFMQPCVIREKNIVSIAFARDISRNGFGLDCERDFGLKKSVTVELRNGRRINGIVVWARTGQINVLIDEPLSANDRLLAI
ncbi:MAG: PilZ domain-containing protein [Hyphomicrobium sp.]|uniref:PilZ domain-containing protein n=1 Tax=Hyphomicrobium sp. TaxID=82 RepID=UPI0039E6FE23